MDKFVITLSLIGLAIAALAHLLPLFAVLIPPFLGFFMLLAFIAVLLLAHGLLSSVRRLG